ncbi:WYL domain-containing protein [Shewanella sp. SM34]|uniref:helix-turn-helix transcriptional regulator n=1 Tax=unclassified Shewanella TaxID=196818 RepID=UPI0021DAC3E3|nr:MULTISPECIES: WYL domain-containing protein [unclassified Shewanella]MCU8059065.1 WYL domain-containing protein [Shewanella sp. SM35]MCU8067982.1 WYL domain-containing protein [Shewanella sp. SM34]
MGIINEQLKVRFKAIEYMAYWEGGVNASRLSRLFGINANLIGRVIKEYRERHPLNLVYDAKDAEKIYIPTEQFSPHYIPLSWSSYSGYMLSHSNEHIKQLYGLDTIADHIAQISNPDPVIMRVLLKAIRQNRKISLLYRSRSNPAGLRREIAPHAISNDGIRWHCRAFCFKRNDYADFNIGRMNDLSFTDKSSKPQEDDVLWRRIVEIHIDANPCLSETERNLVFHDYGKKDQFVIRTRAALVDYTIQFYRLGRSVDAPPKAHPLIVKNIDQLTPYLFSEVD